MKIDWSDGASRCRTRLVAKQSFPAGTARDSRPAGARNRATRRRGRPWISVPGTEINFQFNIKNSSFSIKRMMSFYFCPKLVFINLMRPLILEQLVFYGKQRQVNRCGCLLILSRMLLLHLLPHYLQLPPLSHCLKCQ